MDLVDTQIEGKKFGKVKLKLVEENEMDFSFRQKKKERFSKTYLPYVPQQSTQ